MINNICVYRSIKGYVFVVLLYIYDITIPGNNYILMIFVRKIKTRIEFSSFKKVCV